jgi:hypothetical protein
MIGKLKKYAPIAAVAGYLFVYMNKGWDRLAVDLQSITLAKLQAKWKQLALAAAAGIAIYIVQRMKISGTLKTIIMIGLYLFMGYNIGLAIDPVGCGLKGEPPCNGTGKFVAPKVANPYAPRGR